MTNTTNTTGIIKIGVMPGRINEYAATPGTTVSQALAMAGLDSTGFEIKLDGTTTTDLNKTVDGVNVMLLTKQVKGNAGLVKVGVMPGRINEFAVENGATVADALAVAGLSADGYEIKVDGATVTNTAQALGNANVVLLTKKVKGNAGLIKVGVMPGRINEFAVENGATVLDALTVAGLSSDGYEVKVDGNTVTNMNQALGNANVVLLTKRVKGNAGLIKVGVMPGRINEYALEAGATVADALTAAGLSANGFEIKVDGTTVTNTAQALGNANVVLLTKKVKGNAGLVKVGVMPGRINEFAVENGATVADALAVAGLSADGYEIKVDGATVTNTSQALGNANVVLLTKKVKGNSGLVKIGVMPGRINEYSLENGATVKQALATAGLSTDGFEVKVDGATVTNLDQPVGTANVILLTKRVKGNAGLVKVGVMPGRINEFAVENGATVADALSVAGLSADGYEIKVDGATVTNVSQPLGNANVVLLTKKVKGNAGLVKVGVMPGRINEYAVDNGATVADALAVAGLSADGYEVKVDGTTVTNFSQALGNANVVLLTKKVKGNAGLVKVGVMPGRINEYAVDNGATVADALSVAGLSAEGFEVKVDGATVTNFSQPLGNANVVLLTKKVKGNAGLIKVGVMPGRINEYALEATATISDALSAAGLSADGFEVKVDGNTATNFSQKIGNANVILLTKKVKGNAGLVKVGVMPGRINEFAVENGATVADALSVAGLSADGYEVKVDGSTVTNMSQALGNANVVLLTKKVKGNK